MTEVPMFDHRYQQVGTAVIGDDDHGVVFLTVPPPAVVVEDNQQ